MQQLTLSCPDDWHLHLRDGDALQSTVPTTARVFSRAIVMPNLKPPVTTTRQALGYRARILEAVPPGLSFEPLMTLYLTDNTPPEEVARAKESGAVFGVKLYPAGATTNSQDGVTDMQRVYPTLEAMAEVGMPLLVHGEVTDADVDVFDREAVFIDRVLSPLVERLPKLKVVFEHITTRAAVDFVEAAPPRVAATVTPHHILLNRNAMFAGGVRPHHYCLPVLKRETHRRALLEALGRGSPKFFLGTDSAPHARTAKESDCGCAGIYNAPVALEVYAHVFEQAGMLGHLEGFASSHGAEFYGLPPNTGTVTLRRERWMVPPHLPLGGDVVVPLCAGEELEWKLHS